MLTFFFFILAMDKRFMVDYGVNKPLKYQNLLMKDLNLH